MCNVSTCFFNLSPDIEKESINTPRTNRLSNMAIRTCKNNYAKFWVCLRKDKVSSTGKCDPCFIGENSGKMNGCPRKLVFCLLEAGLDMSTVTSFAVLAEPVQREVVMNGSVSSCE